MLSSISVCYCLFCCCNVNSFAFNFCTDLCLFPEISAADDFDFCSTDPDYRLSVLVEGFPAASSRILYRLYAPSIVMLSVSSTEGIA